MKRRILRKDPALIGGIVSLLLGVVVHLFGLITILHNYDDVAQLPTGYGTGITSGRWLLSVLGDLAAELGFGHNLSIFNGGGYILLVSICAFLTIRILSLHNWRLAALIGALFSVFPTVAATLFFRYTVIYYGIGLCLAVWAVWWTERSRYGGIAAIACLAMSMGIYQAYVPFAIALYVLILIRELLRGEKSAAALIKRGIHYCGILALGVIVYFLLLKLCLVLYHTQLSDYNGVNNMGKIPLGELPRLLKETLYTFCMLPLKNYCGLANMKIIQICYLLLALCAGTGILWILICRIKKLPLILLGLALCAVFPIAVNFIQIMYPDGWIYTLLVYPFVLIGVLPVIAAEAMPEGSGGRCWMEKAVAIVLGVLIFCYSYDTNVNYTALYYTNRQTENYLNAMVTQVRMADGFDAEKKWAFIGDIDDPLYRSPWQYAVFYGGAEPAAYAVNRYSRYHWIQMYFGYTLPDVSEQEIQALAGSQEVRQMPCWPDAGSVKVLGDFVVIKFQELNETS